MKFDYGIHVGMKWKEVETLPGTAYKTEKLDWYGSNGVINTYAAMYVGHGHWVKFYIVDDCVAKIEYLLEK